MKDKHWSPADIEILLENYKAVEIKELSVRLDREVNAIRLKAKELKLTAPKNPEYTKEEDAYILANRKSKTIQEIADHLNRTKSAVNKRIFILAKRKTKNFNRIYAEVEDDVQLNANVSEMLHATLKSLKKGQSFVFEKKHYTQLRIETSMMKPKVFETKSIDEDTSRVWRTF